LADFQNSLAWCGAHPFLPAKEICLQKRGFLNPRTWHELHVLACDPRATVNAVAGFRSTRVEIVNAGIVIVLIDHWNQGIPVILTAFIPSEPIHTAGFVKVAAGKVDFGQLVDLDARLWGRA
jgi:hypothetical protein